MSPTEFRNVCTNTFNSLHISYKITSLSIFSRRRTESQIEILSHDKFQEKAKIWMQFKSCKKRPDRPHFP